MKKYIGKIIYYIMSLVLVLGYFLFTVYSTNKDYTFLQATKDHFYFCLILIIPVLFCASDSFLKNDLKYIMNVVIIMFGLIILLIMNRNDVTMRYGWYVNVILYIILGIITSLQLRKRNKLFERRKNEEFLEETKKMVEELNKNDKFKK